MSTAKILDRSKRHDNYTKQNGGRPLTPRQIRQLRKTDHRRGHLEQRGIHNETKRNRRQRFREWMAGMRG